MWKLWAFEYLQMDCNGSGHIVDLFCLVFAMFCARLSICALWSPARRG